MRPEQVYLAGRYSRRLELCRYREQLEALGYFVQARWLNGGHQIDAVGNPIGEAGEALVESNSEQAADLRAKFADDDFQDVATASIVISFTEAPRQSSTNRGGRHVEFGVALATRARVIVVGHRENIFHWLPVVEFYSTWDECLSALKAEVAVGSDGVSVAAFGNPFDAEGREVPMGFGVRGNERGAK